MKNTTIRRTILFIFAGLLTIGLAALLFFTYRQLNPTQTKEPIQVQTQAPTPTPTPTPTQEPKPIYENVTVEAGITELSLDLFKKEADAEVDFLTDVSQLDLCKTGEYVIAFSYHGHSVSSVLTIADTTPPTAVVVDHEIYNDETLQASDFVTDIQDYSQVDIAFEEQPDFTQLGEQTVTIKLTDTSKNETVLSGKLSVIEDTIAPVFAKMKNITIEIGETVSYKSGVSVSDNRDEKVTFTVDSSKVNLKKEGTYAIVYTAKDSSGNTATATRTLTVLPKPVITRQLVDDMAQDVLDKIITPNMTEPQKLKTIYNWVRSNMYYTSSDETDIPNAAYVAFKKKRGDCYNYFAVTTVLLDKCGIQNMKVERYGGSTSHYWLLVNVGTGWYHCDSSPQNNEDPFRCFMKTDQEIWNYAKNRSDGRTDYYNFDTSLYPERATEKYAY